MIPWDPMAVAVDWVDAYRAARINQIVGLHSPDAVIECACGGRRSSKVREASQPTGDIASLKCPRSELEDLQADGGVAVVSYRTRNGTVQALLDIAENGLITRCRCGPV